MKSFGQYITESDKRRLNESYDEYVVVGTDMIGPSAGKVTKVYDGKILTSSRAQKIAQDLNSGSSPGKMPSTFWFAGKVGELPAKSNAVSSEVKKALNL